LALETNAPISTEDFRTLNRCLDEAIASAVTMYSRESQQSHSKEATERDNERVGFLVHEMRNLVNTAVVAFEVLKSGNVGVGGSTGAVLNRTLMGLRDLIAQSLEDVRLKNAVKNRKRILVSEFIDEIGAAAALEADARGLKLVVSSVQDELAIEADKQILMAVVGNLVQNAFKFTRSHSTVTLRVRASADRVLIDVQDECGGLTGEVEDEDLVPSFEQRGVDRSGLGIGLTFSRWGAEANGGRLYARNLSGKGCVFTMDCHGPRFRPWRYFRLDLSPIPCAQFRDVGWVFTVDLLRVFVPAFAPASLRSRGRAAKTRMARPLRRLRESIGSPNSGFAHARAPACPHRIQDEPGIASL
jgi:K+-sensing histidine kinase KdpD